MSTRREFIKKSVLLSGSVGLATILPASIQRAMAIDPTPGSSYLDAEHIVILMQENRSFDHAFGTLQGVRGFNDPKAISLPGGNPVWLQQNAAGDTYAPFRLNIKDSTATWTGNLPHTRSSQVDAFNFGQFDKWLDSKGSSNPKYADMPLTLGHYTRADLPFNYAMADAFTVCDQNFSSVMTSTYPNRSILWSGTICGDHDGKVNIRNGDYKFGKTQWRTFPEKLEENDVSWNLYQNDIYCGGGYVNEERAWLSNLGCNPLEYFSKFNVKFSSRYIDSLKKQADGLPKEIEALKARLANLSPADKSFNKLNKDLDKKLEVLANVQKEMTTWTEENYNKLSQHEKNLFQRAFSNNAEDPDYKSLKEFTYLDGDTERKLVIPKGDILYKFRKDVNTGKLPTVSWIVSPQNFSDHPSAPLYGAWYVSEILDILTKNPEVWKKTIFILTYDENDGYFDHIPPFIPPDLSKPGTGKCSAGIPTDEEHVKRETELLNGVDKNEARDGAAGLGYRVPMIIASPWSRGGQVCSQVFDHTSSLQFLEKFISHKLGRKIKEDNISPWRRTICGDLTAAFSPFNKAEHRLAFLKKDSYIESIYNAKFKQAPSGFRKFTKSEIEQVKQNPVTSGLLPQQEPGIRPACGLPYELYASGKLNSDKKSFEITMKAGNEFFKERAAGSPFKVYAPGNFSSDNGKLTETVKSRDYAVEPGDSLKDSWPLSAFENDTYHLRLYGPNGFFREFRGGSADPDIHILFNFNPGISANPELVLINGDPEKIYTVEIKHHGYQHPAVAKELLPYQKKGAGMQLSVDTSKSYGWYDFSLMVRGHEGFEIRYAGHLENGQRSFTDPVMGRVTG